MSNKKFTVIILDENSNIYNAHSIESGDEDFNKNITDNTDKFFKLFDKDKYIIKNITNFVKKNYDRLLKKSRYFGLYNPYRGIFIPSSSNITSYPSENPSNGDNSTSTTTAQNAETSLSNLGGVISRLESSLESPFPGKVSDEEWTSFIISEFSIENETDDSGDFENSLEEGLSFNKVNSMTHTSILERKLKKEIKEIKNTLNNITKEKELEEVANIEINKQLESLELDIHSMKKDIQLLFEKIVNILP